MISAFLLTYLHQYAWERFTGHPKLHLAVIFVATLHFLIIPFFFLTNTNLMWFPNIWDTIRGFFSALFFPNIFARYFFFIFSCLTTTALFLHWLFNKKINDNDEDIEDIKCNLKPFFKTLLKISIWGLSGQMIGGILIIFTAQKEGLNFNLITPLIFTMIFFLSGFLLLTKYYLTYELINKKQFYQICFFLILSVFSGGILRHQYRENALNPHILNMKKTTEEYKKKVEEAKIKYGKKDYRYE